MTGGTVARVAVVGAGAVAQVVHLPILKQIPDVELTGLFDVDQAKARILAERFSIPRIYSSIEQVWDDAEVDSVVVCTPSYLHERQVIEGLAAGKYVFCEKPLALTAEGVAHILASMGDRGRLMVGMNQRFRPDAAALKDFLDSGELGKVRYLRAGWLNRRAGHSRRTWRNLKEGAGGGALMDLGIQMLDLSLWLLDYPEPRRLVAHAAMPRGTEVEESAVVLLELSDRSIINLEVTWAFVSDREQQYLQAIGSEGSATLVPLKVFKDTPTGVVELSPQVSPGRENPFTASYRQELVRFTDAVRTREPLERPLEHVTLMKILEGAYRSISEGTEIHFQAP